MIVLGLDGLEHAYVRKFQCDQLRQTYCGQLEVPIDPNYGCPRSPSVWYSFLSGEWNETLDFKKDWRIEFLKKIKSVIPLSLGISRKIRRTLEFPAIKVNSFLTDEWTPFNVPYVNMNHYPYSALRQLVDNGGIDEVADELINFLHHQQLDFINMCRDNMKHLLAVFQFPDYIQHLLDPYHIERIYRQLERFIIDVKTVYDGALIILSDHGWTGETHSNYGFISSNVELNPFPEKITDFYQLFTDMKSFIVT